MHSQMKLIFADSFWVAELACILDEQKVVLFFSSHSIFCYCHYQFAPIFSSIHQQSCHTVILLCMDSCRSAPGDGTRSRTDEWKGRTKMQSTVTKERENRQISRCHTAKQSLKQCLCCFPPVTHRQQTPQTRNVPLSPFITFERIAEVFSETAYKNALLLSNCVCTGHP